eukprot:TRINITY_DN36176_c1_g1_i1.p1 TRINITY_DN36176_c1_g1~~TRINITY_DN36176_c1_g1_i1.p1  ORF type:complete len:380 (+),score=34.75 TRINITY_DN36176_c1_g1_i1:140-1141(+)
MSSNWWAAGISGTKGLDVTAEIVLQQVNRARQKFGESKKIKSELFDSLADPITDGLNLGDLPNDEAEFAQRLEFALWPLVSKLKTEIASHLLECPLVNVRCPMFNWYGRFFDMGNFAKVHNDGGLMIGKTDKEEEFNKQFGADAESWINIWVLLSDATYNSPLVLFNPLDVHGLKEDTEGGHKLNPFVWPPRDFPGWNKGKGIQGYTFKDMKRGDVIVFRSTRVPHASGRVVETTDSKNETRSSFDMRCVCTRRAQGVRKTKNGEICRQAWRKDKIVQHGCSNPDGDPNGDWCQIEREFTGGAGVISRLSSQRSDVDGQMNSTRDRYDYCLDH